MCFDQARGGERSVDDVRRSRQRGGMPARLQSMPGAAADRRIENVVKNKARAEAAGCGLSSTLNVWLAELFSGIRES